MIYFFSSSFPFFVSCHNRNKTAIEFNRNSKAEDKGDDGRLFNKTI
jgi:hypothetical protein